MNRNLLMFSLITLLVALLIGSIAVSINYSLKSATSKGNENLVADQIRPSIEPSKLSSSIDEGRKKIIAENYGKLPLSFEANRGQADAQFDFLARGQGYQLGFNAHQAVIALTKAEDKQHNHPAERSMITMELEGANKQARSEEIDRLAGVSNYFIGNDPTQWRANVPNYRSVKYPQIYPGVDIVYYGNQSELEYDLIVQPGADPATIKMKFAGMDQLNLDNDGNLVLKVAGGELYKHKPVIYQERQGIRDLIAGNYQLEADGSITFNVGAYDHNQPLIIDPIISYSTFLGENISTFLAGISIDTSGNIYISCSGSTNFPITSGVLQPAFAGGTTDVSVTKLNANGTALIYSTYLGGNNNDFNNALVIDNTGNVYVSGYTTSTNFPTTSGAFKTTSVGDGVTDDAFIAKLNSTGTALIYSTLLGGTQREVFGFMAVDSSGNAYVTGVTFSRDFPTTTGAVQTSLRGQADGFVTKLNATGSSLVYSTYLGGNKDDSPAKIVIDKDGNAYIVGQTFSANFPIANPLQTVLNGVRDGFVTKLNSTGTALIYSTYLGGSSDDSCSGIAIDAVGNAYITGSTRSTNYPTTTGAFQTQFGIGIGRVFVTKLNATGTALSYSTFIGGSKNETGDAIVIDPAGNAYITGSTTSTDLPILNAFQPNFGGTVDSFVTKLNSTGSALIYSSYLGGDMTEGVSNIALDNTGNVYIVGQTVSANFPITPGAFRNTLAGNFPTIAVTKIVDCATVTLTPTTLPAGMVNTAYSTQTISATGGITPYTFAVTSGALPMGLSLSSGGQLSGTPITAGTFNFTVTATDANGCMGAQSYSLTIATAGCPTITITPATLPDGIVGASYSQLFTPSGGTAPYNFSVMSGALPIGIPLTGGGSFSGIPRIAGTYNFTLKVVDANGCIGTQSFTVVINPANTATMLTSSLNPASVGQSITFTAQVSPVAPSTLPPTGSVTFFDGQISLGTMTLVSGRATLTTASLTSGTHQITATYNGTADYNTSTSNTVSQVIACPTITLSPTSLPPIVLNQPYNQTIKASGGVSPYSFAVTGGALPTGLNLDSSGNLSGTVTSGSSFTFTITATDTNGCMGSQAYTLIVGGNLEHSTLYVADASNNRIQKSTDNGETFTTVGRTVRFSGPKGVTASANDQIIFVADTGNNRILRSTDGGNSWQTISTEVNGPQGLAYDEANDRLYVADTENSRVLVANSAGLSTNPVFTLFGSNVVTRINRPRGIAVDSSGIVYLADTGNNCIQVNNGSGWQVFAGSGIGSAIGKFNAPSAIFVDSQNHVYVADTNNNRVQINSNGLSNGWTIFVAGGAVATQLSLPEGVTKTITGDIFISDTGNNQILRKSLTDNATKIVGFFGTGTGKFNQPSQLR